MKKLWKLQNGALVLVCDGRKALFLANDGSATQPSLAVREVLEASPVSEPADRPGRRPDRVGADGGKGSMSGMENINPSAQEMERFVLEVTGKLGDRVRADTPGEVVIAAAPNVLGELRKHLPENARKLIGAEFSKDLTHLPIDKIAAAILDT